MCTSIYYVTELFLLSFCFLPNSKIKEETLRTFIFKYGETYDSLSVERLAEMFEMSVKQVHGIVSKMIFKEEILVCVYTFFLCYIRISACV